MRSSSRRPVQLDDTIFALASGSLPCAVANLRLSGPGAFDFAERHFRSVDVQWQSRRGMFFGTVVDAAGQEIDTIVLLCFPNPHSFTGQDVIEIQCHGSLAVVARLERLFVDAGFRPAQAGEFSYRAFHAGKLSGADLENLGDVFLAREPADLDRIYRRRDTSLETEIAGIREHLIRLQAILDTAVDFSEEYAHVVHMAAPPLRAALEKSDAIAARYESLKSGSRVPRLVLAGRPNAGKSSLFNALLCRYRAIVHSAEGTTRDVIEEDIELAGRRWKLVDTAGVRNAASDAESEGIGLGAEFLGAAQFWVLVVDGTQGLSGPERDLLERFGGLPHLIVWNKKDLGGLDAAPADAVSVSALTGEGLRELTGILHERVDAGSGPVEALPYSLQARQLRHAHADLVELEKGLAAGLGPEILGEANRRVLSRLESVVGEVGTEDVLDRVFAEFCIGK